MVGLEGPGGRLQRGDQDPRGPTGRGVLRALRRLYRRRGDAYVNLQKWQEAVDDYAHVITPETTNALLLSNRARAHEGLKHCDAATADWSRAANGNPEGPKLLADFARRLAAGGHLTLAKGQFDKARALYEGSLETAPDSDFRATNLAQLLMDKHKNENRTRWTILQPVEAKSELGATLSVLPDDSILASGANPRNDRYRVVLTVPKKIDLAAVRWKRLRTPRCQEMVPAAILAGRANSRVTSLRPRGR